MLCSDPRIPTGELQNIADIASSADGYPSCICLINLPNDPQSIDHIIPSGSCIPCLEQAASGGTCRYLTNAVSGTQRPQTFAADINQPTLVSKDPDHTEHLEKLTTAMTYHKQSKTIATNPLISKHPAQPQHSQQPAHITTPKANHKQSRTND